LKDVQELFFDTGIGKEGYSIIGQGQIDKILSGKPEERRELFDEAAGIVKFKKRKSIAEKELAEERLNLSRVTDIVTEIERQLGPLEKQSEVAKEYLRLKEELKNLEVNQFLLEYSKNEQSKVEVEQRLTIVNDDLASTQKEFDVTKVEYEKLEIELEQLQAELEDVKTTKNELQISMEKAEGEIKVLQEQILSINQNDSQFNSRIEGLLNNKKEREAELSQYAKEKQEIEEKLNVLELKKSEVAGSVDSIKQRIINFTREIEECNNDIFRFLNDNGTIKTNIQKYETIAEQNSIKKAEINQKIFKIKSEEALLLTSIDQMQASVDGLSSQVSQFTQENQEITESIATKQKEIDALTQTMTQQNQEFLSQNAKLESLRNLTERYDGYGNSIRKVMEQKDHTKGILGVVADIIKVNKDYETAIEIALGGSIQNIVTDTEETAKNLIEYLKKNKFGRATFLPLTSINGAKNANNEALKEKGVIGLASSLVSAESRFENLIQFLLGRIIIVDNIDNAVIIARKYKYTLRMVTLDGEQINPGGSLSGGAYKNASNLLGRRREMEELEEVVQKLKQELQELSNKTTQTKEDRLALREKLESNKLKLQELLVQENTAKMNLSQEKDKTSQMQSSFLEYVTELKLIDEQNTELSENVKRLQASLQENIEASKSREQRIEECNQLLELERKGEAQTSENSSKLMLEYSNLEQSNQYALENMRRVKREIDKLLEEETLIRTEASTSVALRQEKEAIIAECMKKQQEDSIQLLELEERLAKLTESKDVMTKNHKGFFTKREEFSNRINMLDKDAFRLQNQKEKLSEVIDAQITYMWEEYELTVSTAKEYEKDEYSNQAANKKGISELKNNIKQLGDVNVNAIEDYKNSSERYSFLTTQREDLLRAEQTLIGIINELDEEMRRQFEEKFAQIKEQFDVVFKELFGGGKGTLELTEDEDILEAGIRIIAQPPGKKLQNMMQLSGGEKALTAISLLFAIQNLKPSPFCLLDEIEAALDDSNVKRFANYLHKLTKHTQFIIITHRRGTMAAADVLYGITMQEKGVSTLVSVSLIEEKLDE
jgi:chromosome segregation protein